MLRLDPQKLGLALTLALCAPSPPAALGDDRELLRSNTSEPYLFILLDTSASMNRLPTCTAEDLAEGICSTQCETGDCYARLGGDDPESKIYQAKEAIYEVIQDAPTIRYGFATFNQDTPRMVAKHWLYEVVSGGLALPGTGNVYPPASADRVFGRTWNCQGNNILDISGGQSFDGCNRANPADVFTDSWEAERVERFPMLGQLANTTTNFYIRDTNASVYRVRYSPNTTSGNVYGAATYLADVQIGSCLNDSCSNVTVVGTTTVTHSLVGQFYHHDRAAQRTEPNKGYFSENEQTLDFNADSRCLGWDPNTGGSPTITDPFNAETDTFSGQGSFTVNAAAYGTYNLRFPTTHDEALRCEQEAWAYSEGDRLPQDWEDGHDHRVEIAERMAPNLVSNPSATPDFGVASYFNDLPLSGETVLRLVDDDVKPVVAFSRTSLGRATKNFRQWWQGCADFGNACASDESWAKIAAGDVEGCAGDPDWLCRKHFLLIISDLPPLEDGEEDPFDGCQAAPTPADEPDYNNPDDPCANVADLLVERTTPLNSSIETFVISFGRGLDPAQQLECMAREGSPDGLGTPYSARNKDELVEQLTAILDLIFEEPIAFASAAVPTVQANISDKIFLSSFIPLNEAAVWPGRLDSFLKPLPIDELTGLPDRDLPCDTFDPDVNQAECFAWDAGDSQLAWNGEAGYQPQGLLLQAPLLSEITRYDNSSLDIGTGDDQRRILYGLPDNASASVIGNRTYFVYPAEKTGGASDLEQANYEYAWNLGLSADGSDEATANRETIAEIIEFTVAEKQSEINNPDDADNPFHVQYVMGDIFHSNPLVLNPPADFDFYTKDLYWNSELCGDSVEDTRGRGPQISYSWYSNKNLCRRVMIFAGSNDGQLHAFDGGVFEGDDCKLSLPASAPDRINNADDDGIGGEYDYGTGREVFSFIPDAMMPLVQELTGIAGLTTEYGLDGTVRAADVFIDPVPTAGVPTCAEREWRTVLLGHYREGGPGVFALDITQPDTFDGQNVPQPVGGDSVGHAPSCIEAPGSSTVPSGCGDLPFPALKWEFRDLDSNGLEADDDGNSATDLAEGWSRPVVARVQICVDACGAVDQQVEDRFVAIFGGGISETPFNSASDAVGNWLYMVDIETGEAIYKRGGSGGGTSSPIVGSIASDIAAVDENVNGYIDTLYFGTTAGFVYKLDLGEGPFELDADGRIEDPAGDAGAYDPFQVFSTGGRPLYLEIGAVYVPRLRANALLFGTGSRWDLWEFDGVSGRFYALLDQDWEDANRDGVVDQVCGSCPSPLTESQFKPVDPDDTVTTTGNYLFGEGLGATQLPGWYFTLEENEKLITEPFTLAGVTFFTIYSPVGFESVEDSENICVLSGESKIYVVNAVTTTGYAIAEGTTARTRYTTAPTFTTQPFVESSATKNAPTSSTTNADSWTDELALINADLKKLFPPGARFANYTLDIKTIRSDTGIVFIAPVPVAIEPHNWKEF